MGNSFLYQCSEINKSLHVKAPNFGKIITMTKIGSSKIRSKHYPNLQLSPERKLSKDFFIANHFIYSHNAALHV